MFTWASYLFGGESQEAGNASPATLQPQLETTESDDWLVVERIEDGRQMQTSRHESTGRSDIESELDYDDEDGKENQSDHPGSEDTGHSSGAVTDDNSWYVTPPPCFTKGRESLTRSTGEGSPPTGLPESVVENLLIEHPSMSVYHSIHTQPSSGQRQGPPHPSPTPAAGTGVSTRDPRYRRATHVHGMASAYTITRQAQGREHRQQAQRLKPRHLERKNRAREVASHGKYKNRKYFINQPRSHINSH